MRWLLYSIGAMLCSGLAVADFATLQTARIVSSDAAITVVEFAFSNDLRITAQDIGTDAVEVRLRGRGVSTEFDQSDQSYDGELAAVRRVVFEGSGAAGYRLIVELAEPMQIELPDQPDARHVLVRLASLQSRTAAAPVAAVADAQPTLPSVPVTIADATAPAQDGTIDPYRQALAEAREAAMRQDYPHAIVLYTKAAESNDVAVRQQALEMLAMARERNHQDAHAKLIYEQFLAEYPEAEQAPRIRQRLAGLVTRDLPVQRKLRQAQRSTSDWEVSGAFSQFYQRNALSINNGSEVVGIDALFTDADVIVQRRGEDVNFGLRMSGSHLYDLGDESENEYQVDTGYVEAEIIDWGVDVRIGRQSPRSAGVLGRYDGAQIEYHARPWLTLHALGGYAVDYNDNGFDTNTDRPLYGVNAELSVADGRWTFVPFYVEQRADGLLDRRAVGMETRFFTQNVSLFTLADYDLYHEVLNSTYVMGNLRWGAGWSGYANFDHRRSPYILTENALIGQGVGSLGDLENAYDANEIQQLADDRTAEVTLASVGFDKQISTRWGIGSDFAYSDYSSTPASGDVSATPSRADYYYSLRLRADEIYGSQTYSTLYLRYGVGPDSDVSSVYWNNRFTIRTVWQFYPRIRVDYRDFTDLGQTQWTVAPSLRLDYRPRRGMYFELEAGYDQTQREMVADDMRITGYYFRFGYRSLF
jgi:hypothetical protein